MTRSASEVLERIRDAGARRLERVTFRENRSTLWSLTQGGKALNLHSAYAEAPAHVLEAFAALVRGALDRSEEYRRARGVVGSWDPVHDRIVEARRAREPASAPPWRRSACHGTPLQQVYLRRLYRHFNSTRFDGCLPASVPIRLSRCFTSRLGQLMARSSGAGTTTVEIALNIDLMLAENDAQRVDTLLHEMAHAANYLFDGEMGHGPRWRAWARRAGCVERARCSAPIRRRKRRTDVIERVPALPSGWRRHSEKPVR